MEALSKNVLPLKTSIQVTSISKGWTAETIRIARKAHKLTQEELAEELGCRQQTISEWELGMYTPKNAYQRLLDRFFVAKYEGRPLPTGNA
jgi:DNA-binding transcriptional regulator YiaG